MLGSTPITAVLGSGVDNTNHEAVRSFIKSAAEAGLSLLLIHPGSKQPFDGRTPQKKAADDRAAQARAKLAGRMDYQKAKSPSGLALATSDRATLSKYLDRYIEVYGDEVAVNLAVEVGGSGLVVVDCDTEAQKRRFLEAATGDENSDLPPTVVTPGSRTADGTWVHSDGGHFYFTIPEGVTLPTNMGAISWGGEDGFAVLWDRRYVLIPPSTRPEGPYEMVGRDYPLPSWLHAVIEERACTKMDRSLNNAVDEELATSIDTWSENVTWEALLQPLGWVPTSRPDNCGCEVWTAPGDHSSPKSATAHDAGCSLGIYSETNAPLHIWTDNPGEPFDDYIASTDNRTLSKLRAVSWIDYEGNVGKAMDALGISPKMTAIEREQGVNTANIEREQAGHDVGEEIVLAPQEYVELSEPDEEDGVFEPVILENPTDFPDEVESPDPDVFDPDIQGVPVIAPFSHWRDMPPPEYIIEGLIEHGGLSSVIGPPGVGKSSVVLDMACCIATGRPWQGRKVLKTKVLYLPGEGLSGAVQRMKSWCAVNDVPEEVLDQNIRLGSSIIQLGASTEAWSALCEYAIRQGVGLIVFDTFARMSLGIEENSATEVGKAVTRFDQVRRLTNAGVMIVHHTAKNNPSAGRGSSALNGALDSELLVGEGQWEFEEFGQVDGGGRVPHGKKIQLTTSKQKNAEQLEHPIPLLMRSYEPFSAPYITGPSGELDPMVGEIVLARPIEEPVIETAIRIRRFAEQFPEQGVTRADIVAGVKPDSYTLMRRDSTKAWRQKVAVAIDRGLRFFLLETASGQRLGARYVPGASTDESARRAYASEIMSDNPEKALE
jgi:hypothetical protein